MTQINLETGTIAYSDKGAGMPIFWMHGLMMGAEVDEQLRVIDFEQLSQKFRLIRIDAPGHGQSSASTIAESYQWNRLPMAHEAIAQELNIQQKVVAGFSMGSAAAIHYACQHPENIKALILAMPPKIWSDRPEQCKSYNKMAQLASTGRLQRLLPCLLTDTPIQFVEDAFPGSRKIATQAMSSLAPEVYYNLFTAAAQSDYPSKEEVEKLNIPTLILGWEGDDTHPHSSIEQLKSVLPKAEVHIAKNITELKQFTTIVEEFVASHSS
ncbi:alpha/beta hydrolase [Prolixibacteraceae bacterium JC049]|nr:alpha/beta hydrolase [Prolixibacteraceae bacterium JC049]